MGTIQGSHQGQFTPQYLRFNTKTSDAQALSEGISKLGGSIPAQKLSGIEDTTRDPFAIMQLPNGNYLALLEGTSAFTDRLYESNVEQIKKGVPSSSLPSVSDESFKAYEIKPDGTVITVQDSNIGRERDGGTTYGKLSGGSTQSFYIPNKMTQPLLPSSVTINDKKVVVPSVKFRSEAASSQNEIKPPQGLPAPVPMPRKPQKTSPDSGF